MEQSVKDNILEKAEAMFMRLGVRSVTMDDVSKELGMSKKTLYQFFENKDELVSCVAHAHLDKEKAEFLSIANVAENAIDELHKIARCIRKNFSEINPSMLFDLKKYHPEAWKIFLNFKHSVILGNIQKNLVRGIEEGYYRQDIDPEILSIMRVEQVQMLFDEQIFPKSKFDFTEVQMQIFEHFVFGILTDEGRKLFTNFKILMDKQQ